MFNCFETVNFLNDSKSNFQSQQRSGLSHEFLIRFLKSLQHELFRLLFSLLKLDLFFCVFFVLTFTPPKTNMVEVDRHLVLEVLQTASNHQHHLPKQAWGPASTLAIYAKRMNLTIMENGDIIGECFRSINCLHNSSKDIKRFLDNQWQYKIMKEIGHRKGVPQGICFHRGLS